MASLIGFARAYSAPAAAPVVLQETTYRRGDESLPARIYRPARHSAAPLPGWVVLHGLTRTGREHPSLHRFATAVAASGSLVLVPDIPEWRDLRVAPAITVNTIRAAVRALQMRDDVAHEHAGLLGFSFGATQALIAATDPEIAGMLHGIAAWGGYSDLPSLFEFGMTGYHEVNGERQFIEPDPYGSWVMAGNYLTGVPGHEEDGAVAEAVHALAIEAGERGIYAWDPVFDASKFAAREKLRPDQREVFDIIAPMTTVPRKPTEQALALGRGLAAAAVREDPLLDPSPWLGKATVPTLLAHGRDDRLIPYSQTLGLRRALPAHIVKRCTITGLFSHSGGTVDTLGPVTKAVEAVRFAALLRALLNLA
jgi:pimeloyl-ACP methyl ester carboxylesterase